MIKAKMREVNTTAKINGWAPETNTKHTHTWETQKLRKVTHKNKPKYNLIKNLTSKIHLYKIHLSHNDLAMRVNVEEMWRTNKKNNNELREDKPLQINKLKCEMKQQ